MDTQLFVNKAVAELGHGEDGGNNAGYHVSRYKGQILTPGKDYGPWCASFVSWCLEQSGFRPEDFKIDRKKWERKRHSAKWLYKTIGNLGTFSKDPVLGSISCWDRGRAGSWQGHDGIVWSIEPGGIFFTIEGNRGGVPARVDTFKHVVGEGRLKGFAVLPKGVPS